MRKQGERCSPAKKKAIVEDYIKLKSTRSVANKHGVSMSTVRNFLHEAGVKIEVKMNRCKNCFYWRRFSESKKFPDYCCHYMIDNGISKNCRADNCDKYISKDAGELRNVSDNRHKYKLKEM